MKILRGTRGNLHPEALSTFSCGKSLEKGDFARLLCYNNGRSGKADSRLYGGSVVPSVKKEDVFYENHCYSGL